jgi:hypothetical protein
METVSLLISCENRGRGHRVHDGRRRALIKHMKVNYLADLCIRSRRNEGPVITPKLIHEYSKRVYCEQRDITIQDIKKRDQSEGNMIFLSKRDKFIPCSPCCGSQRWCENTSLCIFPVKCFVRTDRRKL